MSTVPSPMVEGVSAKERGDRVVAAVATLSTEFALLGIVGAMVIIDESKQSPGGTTLGFIGVNGVGVVAGELLMRKYLEMKGNPMSEVTYSRVVVSGSGEIM